MLSVVIPTLNAARTLPACLERMRGARELIVVDGGSRDGTQRIAEQAGARLLSAPPGRGVQLAAGAEAARGEWLLFLHADTLPASDWKAALEAHADCYPGRAGCFRFRLDDEAWQARLIERGVELRTQLFGLPYGDQGLFVPRALYRAAGGYRPLPLMEDVDLVRRLGRPRLVEAEAVTSAERWRRDGWARRSARNLACLTLWRFGMSPERVARLYEA
ncbi:MAG: TIGR04283 family arsenosugar biosynthesis glycosyltransferase [Allosphingosinicella sp.]|uniref:TIGR04283 family arsenosugar biosynthesis glycosyltransferase n=1 Tax=Allosphingosinicella sp. TaxID=2823234 RepID=UPI003943864D